MQTKWFTLMTERCLLRWIKGLGSEASLTGITKPRRKRSRSWGFRWQAEGPGAIQKSGATRMTSPLEPTVLVIFGGMGDLAWRKLAPALYNLLLSQQLPGHFAVIGLDMKKESPDEFRSRLRDGASHFCACGGVDQKTWNEFARNLSYLSGDFADPAIYAALDKQLKAYEKKWGSPANHIFY